MVTEENLKTLRDGVAENRQKLVEEYQKAANSVKELREEYTKALGGLKTLSELTETDEVKEKIETRQKEAETIAEEYNKLVNEIAEWERQICCYDGCLQMASYVLEEDFTANQDKEEAK